MKCECAKVTNNRTGNTYCGVLEGPLEAANLPKTIIVTICVGSDRQKYQHINQVTQTFTQGDDVTLEFKDSKNTTWLVDGTVSKPRDRADGEECECCEVCCGGPMIGKIDIVQIHNRRAKTHSHGSTLGASGNK